MESSIVITGLLLLSAIMTVVILKKLFREESPESNFIQNNPPVQSEDAPPCLPEYAECQGKQSGLIGTLIRRAPKTIMTLLIANLFIGFAAGRVSDNTAEKLGIVVASLSYGEYGTAVSALWSIGRPGIIEQTRVTLGHHPDQEGLGIKEFIYVGRPFGKNLAILPRLYSTQDHDKNLSKSNLNYNNVLLMPYPDASRLCKEKYDAEVISFEEWQVVTNHTRASLKFKEYPDTPEWTRSAYKSDSNLLFVIAKHSDVRRYVVEENIGNEDDGLFVNGNDLHIAGFRCAKTWESNNGGK